MTCAPALVLEREAGISVPETSSVAEVPTEVPGNKKTARFGRTCAARVALLGFCTAASALRAPLAASVARVAAPLERVRRAAGCSSAQRMPLEIFQEKFCFSWSL